MLCRICMDRSLDTALFPCGHAVACLQCARRCERCPLCRANIDHCRTIYLPMELTHVDKHNPKLLHDSIESQNNFKAPSHVINESIVGTCTSINDNIWERPNHLDGQKFRKFCKIFKIFPWRISGGKSRWSLKLCYDRRRANKTNRRYHLIII